MRHEFNFFDDVFHRMENQIAEAEQEMMAMRKQMFQLLPHDHLDVIANEITPRVPIVEEKGETKLKLEFDVHQFKPDEVQVKIMGNNILQVSCIAAVHSSLIIACILHVFYFYNDDENICFKIIKIEV